MCWWEDCGQNDQNADEVLGAPNHGYSLSAARENFKNHGHMYDLGKGLRVIEQPKPERLALVEFAKLVLETPSVFDPNQFQRLIEAEKRSRSDL